MVRKEYDFSGAVRGPALPSPGKTRITIMLDDDVLEHFRSQAESQGTGYQTMINAALRTQLPAARAQQTNERPLTATMLRRILREELRQA